MLVIVPPGGGVEEFFDRFSSLPNQEQDQEPINRTFTEHDMELSGAPLSGFPATKIPEMAAAI